MKNLNLLFFIVISFFQVFAMENNSQVFKMTDEEAKIYSDNLFNNFIVEQKKKNFLPSEDPEEKNLIQQFLDFCEDIPEFTGDLKDKEKIVKYLKQNICYKILHEAIDKLETCNSTDEILIVLKEVKSKVATAFFNSIDILFNKFQRICSLNVSDNSTQVLQQLKKQDLKEICMFKFAPAIWDFVNNKAENLTIDKNLLSLSCKINENALYRCNYIFEVIVTQINSK